MSYDLSFWLITPDEPAPATFESAAQTAIRLASVRAKPQPKLIAFAEAFRDRVAAPDAWPADPATEARSSEETLLRLGMPATDLMRALDAAVQVAAAHDVVVFDDQLGIAFLPDGRVFPAEAAAMWKEVRAELAVRPPEPTRASMRPFLGRAAAGVLGPLGYESFNDKGWDAAFRRVFSGGKEEIHFQLKDDKWGGVVATMHAAISHDEVERIHAICLHPTHSHWTGSLSFGLEELLGPGRHMGYPFEVKRVSDLQALARIASAQVAPLLERCRDLRTLEELVNVQGLFNGGSGLRHRERLCNLVVTRLVGSPRWPETLALVRARFATFHDSLRRELLEALVARLNSIPTP